VEAGLTKASDDLSEPRPAPATDLAKASRGLSDSRADARRVGAGLAKASVSMMDADFAECAKALLTIGADLTKGGRHEDATTQGLSADLTEGGRHKDATAQCLGAVVAGKDVPIRGPEDDIVGLRSGRDKSGRRGSLC